MVKFQFETVKTNMFLSIAISASSSSGLLFPDEGDWEKRCHFLFWFHFLCRKSSLRVFHMNRVCVWLIFVRFTVTGFVLAEVKMISSVNRQHVRRVCLLQAGSVEVLQVCVCVAEKRFIWRNSKTHTQSLFSVSSFHLSPSTQTFFILITCKLKYFCPFCFNLDDFDLYSEML